jgi:hypothetical protein
MLKNVLYVLGVVFILIGLLGFFNNPILGIFATDTVHNVIHLLSGVLALAFAGKPSQAKMFAMVFGIIYALVAIVGFLTASGSKALGLFVVNGADNWLHVVIAIVLLYFGFMSKPSSSSASM